MVWVGGVFLFRMVLPIAGGHGDADLCRGEFRLCLSGMQHMAVCDAVLCGKDIGLFGVRHVFPSAVGMLQKCFDAICAERDGQHC